MRRLLVALAVIGSVSHAAAGEFEMPTLRGSTAYEESPYVIGTPSYTRWRGFYGGGQISGSIAGVDFADSVNSLVAFAVRNSVLESRVTTWTTLSKGDASATGGGGFVGYNFQWDDVTLGLEANYTHASFSRSASDSLSRSFLDNTNAPPGHNFTYDATIAAKASVTLTDFATFRARAGWVAGNFMPYGFGGVAIARANVTRSATVTATRTDSFTVTSVTTDPVTGGLITITTPQSVTTTLLLPGPQNETQTGVYAFGYAAGLGMDVLVMPNVFVRGEWEFVQFPNIKAINININTVRLGAGLKF